MQINQCKMLRRRIAFVLGKSILRILSIETPHFLITRRLGEDGRRPDFKHTAVPFHHRLGGECNLGTMQAIHQYLMRNMRQPLDCALHGQQGRLQNIDAVDFLDGGIRDTPGERVLLDRERECIAFFFRERFGVGNAGDRPGWVQDYRGRVHGPCQWPPARFVHSADQEAGHYPTRPRIACAAFSSVF